MNNNRHIGAQTWNLVAAFVDQTIRGKKREI